MSGPERKDSEGTPATPSPPAVTTGGPVSSLPSAATGFSGSRGLSSKAVLAGLVGISIIGLYSSTNDRILKLSPLVGNHMPVGAFSYILMLAVLWNPLIGRLSARLRFGTRELAVVLGMMLICSWVPGSSFYRYFQDYVIMPWRDAPNHPQWAEQGTLTYLPDRLYPLAHDQGTDPAHYLAGSVAQEKQQKAYDRVYGSYVVGLPVGNTRLPFSAAPYQEWLPAAARWMTLALSMSICLVAMVWLIHRQWAHHEQLAYPIASVATALIERTGNRLTSDIFYSKLFWGGFVPIFLLHQINFLHAWFPDQMPGMTFEMWMWDLHERYPILNHVTDHTGNLKVAFSIVGMAYFIPSEISLSMGLCTIIITLVGVVAYASSGTAPSGDDENRVLAGAYVGYFLILLYTGRFYLLSVARTALWLAPARTPVEREQTWAARIFVLASVVFVILLIACTQLDWMVAILFALSLMVYFLVFARIIAETGLPFLQASWDPGLTLCQVLGFPAIGPANIVLLQYIGWVLNPDARECVTPYVANSLKMADNVGLRIPRLIPVAVLGTVVALIVGFYAQTYSTYNKGAHVDEFAIQRPGAVLDKATEGLTSLHETGLSTISSQTHGLAKLKLLGKNVGNGRNLGWMGFGIAGVLALSLLRFRFLWWPLHPVIFLMWGTWTSSVFWVSFLIGWIVKVSIVRFGGGRTYQSLKPLFIGMIMGEIVAVTVTLIVGFIYYVLTSGLIPKAYNVFPG